MRKDDVTYKPLIKSGIFLEVGLGGFFDGILFHQLMQIHNIIVGGWLAVRKQSQQELIFHPTPAKA